MSETQFEKNDEAERARKSVVARAHACDVEMGKMKRWDTSSGVESSACMKDECCDTCIYVEPVTSGEKESVRDSVEWGYTHETNFVVMKKLMDESKEIVERGYSSHMEGPLLKELYHKNRELWELAYSFIKDIDRVGARIEARLYELGDKDLMTEVERKPATWKPLLYKIFDLTCGKCGDK